jgi:hypothetical protein
VGGFQLKVFCFVLFCFVDLLEIQLQDENVVFQNFKVSCTASAVGPSVTAFSTDFSFKTEIT